MRGSGQRQLPAIAMLEASFHLHDTQSLFRGCAGSRNETSQESKFVQIYPTYEYGGVFAGCWIWTTLKGNWENKDGKGEWSGIWEDEDIECSM
ncbi:unnamed protein product [Mycena citricolor]|uniref:Uncharacterized protein n=1 Tax=Mycena citricolor TaxID=2018698 RepID=A0AAD2HKC0_9AGAR|nr:unnamed protein product [Mycena citricolor]